MHSQHAWHITTIAPYFSVHCGHFSGLGNAVMLIEKTEAQMVSIEGCLRSGKVQHKSRRQVPQQKRARSPT